VLAVEHQLAVLVVDRGPGRHLTGVAVRGQIDDLQLRVERVTGVDLGEEPGAVNASTCRPWTTGAEWPWLRA
jgi:hypothetical protein